jgi:predicted TIM-barrel enzyme
LDREIAARRRRREKLAAELAAEDAAVAALLAAQAALIGAAVEEERLHGSHSERTISGMQVETSHSLGVRIAGGRAGQSASRKAQIAANLTDKQVAELTGYERSTVCKWHNGTVRVPEDARKLLAKRGIPASSWSKR